MSVRCRGKQSWFFYTDTPGKPHSLAVEYGRGTDVTLSWLAPSSDGGSLISEYLVEKRENNSDKWVKVHTTRLAQLRFDAKRLALLIWLVLELSSLYF